ncbi:RHS repeat protein [Stenotrophomonas maltophilia]|uniref:RHS repeat protein n=7 Tax=Bacteria TaxID=2 RepID=A0ABY7XZY7_9GAMM|nr:MULTISPECIES: RHS repeat-associated core domain-containing protein [Stenotrophomonas]MBH1476254.1 RHS repeat protein [Stenotrophomonas maltophilia]MBH1501931.1 RHS repeat protein [Stenotrophomonas maltophilia]MBH1785124.1 RHS repeat protein [Stenotrophomonas maltophilia]WDM63281.1 RHS repeat protein [Stenotrophomonas sp. DFS-20110405]
MRIETRNVAVGPRASGCAVLALLFGLCFAARAQQVVQQPYQEYDKKLNSAEQVGPLTSELFGDSINVYDQSGYFKQTDIDLAGNNLLPVRLERRLNVRPIPDNGSPPLIYGGAGDWSIDVPFISGVFDSQYGWTYRGSRKDPRCSTNFIPYTPPTVRIEDIWSGYTVNLPGEGARSLMGDPPAGLKPVSRQSENWSWTTSAMDTVSCTPMIAGLEGEGFILQTTSGIKYTFNIGTQRAVGLMGSIGANSAQARVEIYLLASRIEDRFGNSVSISYNGNGYPTNITSSDGRSILLNYVGNRLQSASANGRTWTYGYAGNSLQRVTQPDGAWWEINHLSDMRIAYENWPEDPSQGCGSPPFRDKIYTLQMKHPSGAIGTFSFRNGRRYRAGVPASYCIKEARDGQMIQYLAIANYFENFGLTEKTIEGPGIAPMRWTYTDKGDYQDYWAGNYPYCSTCTQSKAVRITQPDGSWVEEIYGIVFRFNDGKLLGRRAGNAAGTVLETEELTYVSDAQMPSMPFPDRYGWTWGGNDGSSALLRPLQRRQVTRDGVTMTWQANSFDSYGRPASVTRSSSHGGSRTDVTTYYNDTSGWILGLPASRTNSDTGLVEAQNTYTAKAQLVEQRSFGRLIHRLGYHADGNVASVKDGNGNTTTLERWKLGIPQWISHADGTVTRAAVNDSGWITAVADENDYLTQYEYDAMGRLTRVEYPSDDSVAWNAKRQALEWVPLNEYGIPPGHWRQTTATGNARKITYFDALLRPMLTQEFDAGNQAATQRLQLFAYDAQGRQTFSSYPVSDFPVPWKGTWKEYDALGRLISSSQDSEHGLLSTLTEYLPGGQMRVTNPRGQVTQTRFQMFDEPSYEHPVSIQMPEGAVMNIARDVFNKPLIIARGNANGSQTVARRYVYSPSQQLCKTIEPETGSTLMDYDGAGNLIWSASGVDSPSPLTCNTEAISSSGRAVYREYDARNRPTYLRFPDGNGNTSWTYTPDGLPSRLLVRNDSGATTASNHYFYNKRRLLTVERVSQPDWNDWPIIYSYNANGHPSGQTWPSGLTVDYAPDALGQATRVGNFATDVRYYANGGIKQFTYGNGIVHTMQQNERQLPSRTTDSGVLDFDTRFDRNGNVSDIYDLALGAFYNRHMLYDGLDRLIAAGSNNFGGDSWHRFSYDTLDNLTSWMLPGVKDHRYWYDAHNRLTNVRDGVGNTLIGLSYDVQGNLKLKNGLNHSFDFGNRLREVTGKETYRYDALGRRILASAPGLGVVLSQYAQDGRLVFQSDGRKGLGREYVHLAGSLIARRDYAGADAKITYLHTDALGSPVASTDASGNVIERTHYEPYGAPIGKVVDGPGYTGHVMDGETGLVQMQQRYMDPQLGVFLSVDPVTAYEQPVGQFNRYRYANGNPYKFTDPDGRESGAAYSAMYRAELKYGMNTSGTTLTKEQVGVMVDFMPIFGDAKGFVDAYNNPSLVSIGAAMLGVAGPLGDGAAKLIKGVDRAASGVKLSKQLGSEQQLGELMSGKGEVIAGGQSGVLLRDSPRLSAVHGGSASDWVKVSSSSHKAPDGQQFSTHAYQNQATGQVVEPKTKLIEEGR